jgi:hypothetical protein
MVIFPWKYLIFQIFVNLSRYDEAYHIIPYYLIFGFKVFKKMHMIRISINCIQLASIIVNNSCNVFLNPFPVLFYNNRFAIESCQNKMSIKIIEFYF